MVTIWKIKISRVYHICFTRIPMRRNFFARSQNAVKVIRASTGDDISLASRALKAVTSSRDVSSSRCIAIQEISPPRMNTDAYDNGALCREDDSQRIFPECADTGIVGLPRGYRSGTSTARNYFDELITLGGFLPQLQQLRISILATHRRVRFTPRDRYNVPSRVYDCIVLRFVRLRIVHHVTPGQSPHFSARYSFAPYLNGLTLSSFFRCGERWRKLFVIISSAVREYRYYPPFPDRKKLSRFFVNPREKHFSRLRSAAPSLFLSISFILFVLLRSFSRQWWIPDAGLPSRLSGNDGS